MHHDRLIEDQNPVPFVVSPNAPCLGIGRSTPEHAAEHFQGALDPKVLVDGSLPVPFDAGDEQNDKNTFAAREQRHAIYIDRKGRLRKDEPWLRKTGAQPPTSDPRAR